MSPPSSASQRLRQISSAMGSYTPAKQDLQSIISQLTLEEKTKLLAGADFWTTNPIPRVGVPPLKVSDGPNGARGGTFVGGITSACFPASVSLAATFDRDLAVKIGKALGEETKTKGAHVLLGPTVCPHRDPRGGRNFESFSEDPYLAGELASQYVIGLQREGVGATIKHYAVNEQETRRFTVDAHVSQRALREIYLKPFEIAIKKSEPWAVMTSYNLINGKHADANKFLITDVLRNQWGFKGAVMSDWGGTNSVAESLNAGHDLEMPGPAIQRTFEKVTAAVKNGELTEETVDRRVEAILKLLEITGKFENPEIPEEKAIDLPEHREIIRQVGAEGMVLLKNDRNTLPLQKEKVKSIAMLGLAKTYLGHGGGSAAVNSHRKITPYEGFEEVIGDRVELLYSEGARIIRNLPAISADIYDEEGKPGLTQRVYRSSTKDGQPQIRNVKSTHFASIDVPDATSASLYGTFKPTVSGNHYISFCTVGNSNVYINDEPVFKFSGNSADVMAFLLNTATEEKKRYQFEAGKEYKIRIEGQASQDTNSGFSLFETVTGFHFGFTLEEEHDADLLTPAIETAKAADAAIVFVGNNPTWETEGADRETMDLPKDGSLDKLISETAKVNPNTIVVNSTGSPITMPWINDVAAVLQTWFPGQEAGHSIADVIFGTVNPAGKLPVTFPKSISDAPSYGNFPGNVKDLVEYAEGIFIGYRHYDRKPEGVLFPFGFGLSYSTFELSSIATSTKSLSKEGTLSVTAEVKNTGAQAGSEVVQIYVGADSGVDRPEKELAGFAKAKLQPGESKTVTVTIDRDSVSYWNEDKNKWSVDAGKYKVFVGTSSVAIASTLEFDVAEAFDYEP